jgi:hypothetical protein
MSGQITARLLPLVGRIEEGVCRQFVCCLSAVTNAPSGAHPLPNPPHKGEGMKRVAQGMLALLSVDVRGTA